MPAVEVFALEGRVGTRRCRDCGGAAAQVKVIRGTRRGNVEIYQCARCAVHGRPPEMRPGRIRTRQATPDELAGLRARTRREREALEQP